MDTIRQDLRFAWRVLRRQPSFSLIVIVSLALAIAGNTIVFGMVNGFLMRALPYPDAKQVMVLAELADGDEPLGLSPASAANFLDWRRMQQSFSSMGALRILPMALEAEGKPRAGQGAAVSPELFEMLGATPAAGRLFTPEEEAPGLERVLVLSHGFWQTQLGGDLDWIGRDMIVDGHSHQVVGILGEDFEVLDPGNQIWVPLALDPAALQRSSRDTLVFGRLLPEVGLEQARAEMADVAQWLKEDYPESNRGFWIHVAPLRDRLFDRRNRGLLAAIQGAFVLVLLVACANIANLMLARGQKRQREMALRTSLGAGRQRLVRQLLTESVLLAAAGGALGIVLGKVGLETLGAQLAASLPTALTPVLDLRVLTVSLLLTVFAALFFGSAPILQSLRLDLTTALKEGHGTGKRGAKNFVSQALVVGQVVMALILLGGGSVLILGLKDLRSFDAGFEVENLLSLEVSFPAESYPSLANAHGAAERLLDRLAALPGVSAGFAADQRPRNPVTGSASFSLGPAAPSSEEALPQADWILTSPSFHRDLRIPLLQGRWLEVTDRESFPAVALINQSLAQRHWPGEDAVGRQIYFLGETRQVVGVVGDVVHGIFTGQEPRPSIYLPLAQNPSRTLSLSLRTEVPPATLVEQVREEILRFDTSLAAARVQPLEAYIAQFFRGSKVISVLLAGFGGLALILAIVGIYGILAFSVGQRTQELGLRMAVGAGRGRILRMVTGQGLKLAFVGSLLGIPLAFLASRGIGNLLADLVETQPLLVLPIAAVLVATATLASLAPAWKAAKVDPVIALRAE